MAASILSAPGGKYGPCTEPCEHRDCGATREMAAALCGLCAEPIGYHTRFYRVSLEAGESSAVAIRDRKGTVLADLAGQLHELRHASCVEEAAL